MPRSRRAQRVNKSTQLTPLHLRRKIGLLRSGKTAADIAREVGVSRAAVSAVVTGRMRSQRIEQAIAQALGEPVGSLFPDNRAA